MRIEDHLRLTGSALKNWLIAQCEDSLAVGAMWYVGLRALHVPLAPLWAGLAAVLQFVPHLGPALSVVAPTITAAIHWGDWRHPLYVLILYAGIVVVDTLALQPFLMKRTAKVPIWASILTPIVLAFVIPFWGIFFAPPVLAVIYAYKRRLEQQRRNIA
ncbi:MAG TPA: AI-2E family transporter [Candidatus Acidoferrum sp.]|nr:AI-2E family transporter [Candidatus Acidoferrum sp.]